MVDTAVYPVWARIINEHELKIGVELGVDLGGNADYMLGHTAIEKLYGIDPYYRPGAMSASEVDALCRQVLARLAPYGPRYQHIRKHAEDAVHDVPSELDFIYVDHNHNYDGMKRFFHDWIPKLRIGGIVGGDGYYENVKLVVDEECKRHDWAVIEEELKVFWFEKRAYIWRPI